MEQTKKESIVVFVREMTERNEKLIKIIKARETRLMIYMSLVIIMGTYIVMTLLF